MGAIGVLEALCLFIIVVDVTGNVRAVRLTHACTPTEHTC